MKRALVIVALSGAPCFAADSPPTGGSLPVGDAPGPPVIRDSAVAGLYDERQMERARAVLAEEHGGATVSKVMANLLEGTSAPEGGGYRWDGEAWFGGDTHRFVFKSEGEGIRRGALESADAQALSSRAIGRYTDLQAGVRYEFQPDHRSYATVAVESLLPYWFEVQAALFLSDRGDLFSRLESHTDLRLTQRLILQPRLELSLAARDVPDAGIGSGLSHAEFGLRLRYEVRREFAPYLGVNFGRQFGRTADFARAAGNDSRDTTLVLGVRGWF